MFTLFDRDGGITGQSGLYVVLFGLVWATGIGCIGIALRRFDGQISQLVPLYNMNTLVAVVLGLIILSEWRNVNATKLVMAAILIIAGGVLAAQA